MSQACIYYTDGPAAIVSTDLGRRIDQAWAFFKKSCGL